MLTSRSRHVACTSCLPECDAASAKKTKETAGVAHEEQAHKAHEEIAQHCIGQNDLFEVRLQLFFLGFEGFGVGLQEAAA